MFSDEQIITLTAGVAAANHPGVVLLDSSRSAPYLKAFVAAYQPAQVIPVGQFGETAAELEQRLGAKVGPVREWPRGPPLALWKDLFSRADQVVVCPSEPRSLLLHAACLAGASHAPLFVAHGSDAEKAQLRRCLTDWQTGVVFCIGAASEYCRDLEGVRLVTLAGKADVAAAYLRAQRERGPIATLVVTNPADTTEGHGSMSALAPWVALRQRAALLFTNAEGADASPVVRNALKQRDLEKADALVLVGNPQAMLMVRRPTRSPARTPTSRWSR